MKSKCSSQKAGGSLGNLPSAMSLSLFRGETLALLFLFFFLRARRFFPTVPSQRKPSRKRKKWRRETLFDDKLNSKLRSSFSRSLETRNLTPIALISWSQQIWGNRGNSVTSLNSPDLAQPSDASHFISPSEIRFVRLFAHFPTSSCVRETIKHWQASFSPRDNRALFLFTHNRSRSCRRTLTASAARCQSSASVRRC